MVWSSLIQSYAKPSTKLMGGLATQLTLADTLMTQKPSLGILEASNYHVKRRGNQHERWKAFFLDTIPFRWWTQGLPNIGVIKQQDCYHDTDPAEIKRNRIQVMLSKLRTHSYANYRASLWPNHEKLITFYKQLASCKMLSTYILNFASKTGFCSSIAITVNLKLFLIRPSEPWKACRGTSDTTRSFKTDACNSQLQFGKTYRTTTASQ